MKITRRQLRRLIESQVIPHGRASVSDEADPTRTMPVTGKEREELLNMVGCPDEKRKDAVAFKYAGPAGRGTSARSDVRAAVHRRLGFKSYDPDIMVVKLDDPDIGQRAVGWLK